MPTATARRPRATRPPTARRIANESVRTLLAVAAADDAEAAELLRAAGIDPRQLDVVDGTVDLDAHYDLWRLALQHTGDPGLPSRVARSQSLDRYRVLAYVCMTAADLDGFLARLARFIGLWLRGEDYRFDPCAGGGRLSMAMQVRRLHDGHRASMESAAAKIVHGGRQAAGFRWTPREVCFAHPRGAGAAALEDLLRCPVRFSAGGNWIAVDAADLARPMRKADAGLARFFEDHASQLLRAAPGPRGIAERARRATTEAIAAGDPTLGSVARRLALSARTFRRRLADEGTCFRELLDHTRRDLARRYLVDEQRAPGEVALLLGFSEPSAFFRAFKRWTGRTPDEFRRAAPTLR